MNTTLHLDTAARRVAHSRSTPNWLGRWFERHRLERDRRRRLRAAERLLQRAEALAATEASYAADIEAAALATWEGANAGARVGRVAGLGSGSQWSPSRVAGFPSLGTDPAFPVDVSP